MPLQKYGCASCQKMCGAPHYVFEDIFIMFSSKLYRYIFYIQMGTKCAPLVAFFVLFCFERDFMLSLSDNNQADVIITFKSTSRY